MSINLSIDFNQLKSLIRQCEIEEKAEIIRMLEQDTFPLRFRRFLDNIQTDDLNLEDITAEVETVREKRYCAKK